MFQCLFPGYSDNPTKEIEKYGGGDPVVPGMVPGQGISSLTLSPLLAGRGPAERGGESCAAEIQRVRRLHVNAENWC